MAKISLDPILETKIDKIYEEEKIKLIQEKWESLSGREKKLVLEMIKEIYPEKSKLISEAKWYNTVGDIVGIFDPTGVVDLINGISYWRQGDKLFAVLSWISVIPYVGDLVAKPVVGLFKMGGKSAKLFKAAAKAGDAAKMAEIAKQGGPLAGLLKKVNTWAPKVLEPLARGVKKVPGIGPGLVKGVEDYIKLFKDAAKNMDVAAEEAIKLTTKAATNPLTKAEAKQLKNALNQATNFRGARDFKGGQSWLQYMKSDATLASKLSAGVPRLWGNPATRALMRRTKWYLGLLDFLGVANFVGPDELETKIDNLDQKVNEYAKTDQSQQYFEEDMKMAGPDAPETAQTTPEKSEPLVSKDAITTLIGMLT
jgi:Sec-independent protein translocase protein TatA